MDNLTKEQRKLCMAKIKGKNTKLEIIVRKILSKLGWKVYKIWECQTSDVDKITQKLLKIL